MGNTIRLNTGDPNFDTKVFIIKKLSDIAITGILVNEIIETSDWLFILHLIYFLNKAQNKKTWILNYLNKKKKECFNLIIRVKISKLMNKKV